MKNKSQILLKIKEEQTRLLEMLMVGVKSPFSKQKAVAESEAIIDTLKWVLGE